MFRVDHPPSVAVVPLGVPTVALAAVLSVLITLAGWTASPVAAQEGPPLLLGTDASCFTSDLDLAAGPGGFAALWSSFVRDGRFLRLFDPQAAALSREIRLSEQPEIFDGPALAVSLEGTFGVLGFQPDAPVIPTATLYQLLVFDTNGLVTVESPLRFDGLLPGQGQPVVVAHPSGGFLVVRILDDDNSFNLLRVDAQGTPVGEVVTARPEEEPQGFDRIPVITHALVTPDGDLWLGSTQQLPTSPPSGTVVLVRVPGDGNGVGDVVQQVKADALLFQRHFGITAQGNGVALLFGDGGKLTLERYDSEGIPLEAPRTAFRQAVEGGNMERVVLTGDPAGNLLLAWAERSETGFGSDLLTLSLSPEGEAVGEPRPVAASASSLPEMAALSLGAGRALVSWAGEPSLPFDPVPCPLNPGPKVVFKALGGPQDLLLQDGRFRVTVAWETDASGTPETGPGHAVPGTDDTGSFWFFDPDNLELTIKILDGRTVNGHFWVFYGALSNVGYTITVEDQIGGVTRTFENPDGRLASLADTFAFPAP